MAGKDLRYGVLLLALICMAYRTNAEAVTATDCTTNTQCSVANSVCDTAADPKKCKCSENYIQNPDTDTECIQVIGIACTAENAAAKCTVANSECNADACACKTGYKKSDAGACEMILGMSCESDSTVCEGVTHSECGTDKKCGCATNYEAKDAACLLAAGQTCTTNAECASDKCEGEEGKKKCAEGNSAPTVLVSAGTITLSLLLLAFQRIF